MQIIPEHLDQWEKEEHTLTRKSSNLLFWLNMFLFPFGTPILGYVFQEPASIQMNIIVSIVIIISILTHVLEQKYNWNGTIYIHVIYLLTFATLGYIAAIVQNKLLITIYVLANITNYIAGAVVVFWKTSHSLAVCIYSLLLNFLMYIVFSTHTVDNYIGLWALVIPVAGCSVALNWFKYNPLKANYLINIQLSSANEQLNLQKDEIAVQNEELHQQQEEIIMQRDALQEAYHEIHRKNEDILASINYARRIQKALLPSKEEIDAIFPQNFVLFKPRDIVSGDFYWCVEKDERKFIAAADCTGHGIPGAFMSMIGVEMLNEIVVSKDIMEADKILNKLNSSINKALRQDEGENKDGMDIALCVFHPTTKELEYAGAMNPIIYVQNNELLELKATKKGVGGHQLRNVDFQGYHKHLIPIHDSTMLYLFSDGFQDQFGGKDGRKFMIKNLRQLFFEISPKPSQEQKQILKDTITHWMGEEHKQIDDILVIGIRL
jgi:serine phosphatase RsbU (regulator of sigma subunit)